jgi:dipeptidyl aminopeptidase/acylaminoacyl peptidase
VTGAPLARDMPQAPQAVYGFTAEDASRLRFIREAGFVRDGRHGFYTMSAVEGTDEITTISLFSRDGSGQSEVAALRGTSGATSSPDGTQIAVVADADGTQQIFLVSVEDRSVRQLTTVEGGVAGRPDWSADGRQIAFAWRSSRRHDPSLPYRLSRVTYRADGLGYLDFASQDIAVVDVETGSVSPVTDSGAVNSDPRWSPDGSTLAYLVSFQPDREWTFLPSLHLWTAEAGDIRVLVDDWGGVFAAEWCPSGEHLAFIGCKSTDGFFATEKFDLWVIATNPQPVEPECRTLALATGVGARIQADIASWGELTAPRLRIDGESAYVCGQTGGDVSIYTVALSGPEAVESVLRVEGSAYLADFEAPDQILYLQTSFTEPPDLALTGKFLTRINDDIITRVSPPVVRRFDVTAPDGVRFEAWAFTPSESGGPWPAVLYIHGGPYGAFGSTYMIDFHLLASAGFAVIAHNFRGSAGYGSAFSRRIVGQWGTAGSLDHHAALDEAIRLGMADPERLGVCGYSHGGYATCWLLGTSDRFKAGVAENPSTNWETAYGVSDVPWWIPAEFGGTPDEMQTAYREQSPLTYAANCKTPLLLVVGESDMRCNPIESEQFYRVLKSNGVTTEMLRLPNSSHLGTWIGPVTARTAQNEALVEWFTRFLSNSHS